ncbi:MAG: DNA polymerase III subunit beta [Bifidobacteriaceae bacterium]|nr:DNA polymerase III subunit beta [Bifidobacteriaceae bacterium]
MRLMVDRDVLADAVGWVARALPARPPSPVLAGVHITATTAGAGLVRLTSFNYEVSAKAEAAADVSQGGEILVSGRLLAEIAKYLPAKPVSIVLEASKIVLTCGSSVFTLPTMPLEDYPPPPALPNPAGTVNATSFANAVAQVSIAATRDETLPLLTGVRLEIQGDHLILLATDRYRLAIRELEWHPTSPDASRVALVKARTLSDVSKSFGATEDVQISLGVPDVSDIIGFAADGRETTSLLIDGDYPQVRSLFPDSFEVSATMDSTELIEAVRRVSLVNERKSPVQIVLSPGQATLNSGAGDEAQASDVIEATLDGPETAVAFNPQYLLDGLTALGTPEVRLSMNTTTKPVLFQGEIDGQIVADYKYLLVPIRFGV